MTTNQCDGCRRGIPLENGKHTGPGGFWAGDVQVCTADRYVERKTTPETERLIRMADRALEDLAQAIAENPPIVPEVLPPGRRDLTKVVEVQKDGKFLFELDLRQFDDWTEIKKPIDIVEDPQKKLEGKDEE